jgi:glycosyltransferase involved in cell wall biosynthesis
MTLTFFIATLYPGGAERQLVYIINELASRGHKVTLLTLDQGEAYRDELDESVIQENLATRQPATALLKLVRWLRRERPDVLVNFLYHSTLLGRVAGRLAGVKVVSSYRNTSYGSALRDSLIRLSSPLDHLTLSNVEAARGVLCSPTHPLQVIPNLYQSAFAASQSASALPERQNNRFHWLFLGRLETQKNLTSLIEAMQQLEAQASGRHALWLVGEGKERDTLMEQIDREGLGQAVTLLGHRADPLALLQHADALILPSHREGMPNALMEAMACGTATVATPVGAVPEMLADERGVLTDGTSSNELADAMRRLSQMPNAQRHAMAERATQYIHHACSLPAVVDQWERELSSMISGNNH